MARLALEYLVPRVGGPNLVVSVGSSGSIWLMAEWWWVAHVRRSDQWGERVTAHSVRCVGRRTCETEGCHHG